VRLGSFELVRFWEFFEPEVVSGRNYLKLELIILSPVAPKKRRELEVVSHILPQARRHG
jgi:hypothetical protein